MLAQTLQYIKSKVNQNVIFTLTDFSVPLNVLAAIKNIDKVTNSVQVSFYLNGGNTYVAWYPITAMRVNKGTDVTTVYLENSGLQITKIPHAEA